MTKHSLTAPFTQTLPTEIYFRSAAMPAEATYPCHRHSWGEFVYAFSGVIDVKLADCHYLAPPQYGIWLPPHVEHTGTTRYEAFHSSLYIAEELCARLPATPCALAATPLIRALLEHLRQQPPGLPQTEHEERLLGVLVDQLASARRVGSYLPTTEDAVLGTVLRILEANPADGRSLPELAQATNTTERTLMRRARRDLGMTLAEWRQRLRVVKAMSLLEQGSSVESIAFDLGYASSSAFITMFRRLTDETPDQYRKRVGHTLTRPAKRQ
ncbi:AraC family transcriptional regulator [Duganella sp. BJB475]|nr:AraC family transcriptional regulator [Duganella sp. BJB475]RFP25304.1 AraC family transcriptional regulator [Duganella sp. BJB476]